MEFAEKLASLSKKVKQQRSQILTEEAAKNAFVMPFISLILGYDVFNPMEVVPEFVADVGVKKGEKVDYAIVRDGEVQMLIECKKTSQALKIEHASQLFRYFSVTTARVAVLTNGEIYQFYTDLDSPNKMDEKPFLVLDLADIDDALVPELRKLTKDTFDLDSILSAAGELKYIGQIKRALAAQLRDPDDEWVKFFTSRVYEGAFTQKVREQFRELVAKASKQFLNDQVNERLKAALGNEERVAGSDATLDSSDISEVAVESDLLDEEKGIETTLEELEGYQIVRAIVCSDVKLTRVTQRDTKSYFGILLDDNNRKPIARLHFNRTQKYIGLFDKEKVETRHPIQTLDEIYDHVAQLRTTIGYYDE